MSNIIEELNTDTNVTLEVVTPTETVSNTPTETVSEDVKKIDPKTITFCLTGKTFSSKFLLCWTTLVNYCINKGHTLIVSHGYNPNKFTEKNLCIGGYDAGDISQKPFEGKPITTTRFGLTQIQSLPLRMYNHLLILINQFHLVLVDHHFLLRPFQATLLSKK